MFHWDLLIPLAGMATGLIILMPIIRAVTRYLDRQGRGSGSHEVSELREELNALRDRFGTAEAIDERLTELEERLDFAERMLTRSNEPKNLGDGVNA